MRENRPTKSEIGKTQKIVKALRRIVVKADIALSQRAVPDTETDNPVLDKLDSEIQVGRWATGTREIAKGCEPRDCTAAS